MIAVDWGISSFRAWRLDSDGGIVDRIAGPWGIRAIGDRVFAAVLDGAIGAWRGSDPPVLLCGMIGSRQGWIEAPYVSVPASLPAIAGGLVGVPGDDRLRIVPGLSFLSATGADVMRGEETQLVGVAAVLDHGAHVVCLPGTHSKWATLAGDTVTGFRSAMTGEIFALMRDQSILAPLIPPGAPDDLAAFDAGVARAAAPGGLLNHLFAIRAAVLLGALPPEAIPSFLSGLLIGHEIAALSGDAALVHVVGGEALTARYLRALSSRGITARVHDEDSAAAGLVAIARAAGLGS